MTLEDKINEFITDGSSRFSYVDVVTTDAFNAAQGYLDNLYDTKMEADADPDSYPDDVDFLSDYYVAGILDRVADELGSMHSVDAEDNVFWVELKEIVDEYNNKAAA